MSKTIASLLSKVLVWNVFIGIIGAISLVMIMYGAVLVMTSGGNISQVKQGKYIIMKAIVGTIFVYSSVFLVNLIGRILGIPGFGN